MKVLVFQRPLSEVESIAGPLERAIETTFNNLPYTAIDITDLDAKTATDIALAAHGREHGFYETYGNLWAAKAMHTNDPEKMHQIFKQAMMEMT